MILDTFFYFCLLILKSKLVLDRRLCSKFSISGYWILKFKLVLDFSLC